MRVEERHSVTQDLPGIDEVFQNIGCDNAVICAVQPTGPARIVQTPDEDFVDCRASLSGESGVPLDTRT